MQTGYGFKEIVLNLNEIPTEIHKNELNPFSAKQAKNTDNSSLQERCESVGDTIETGIQMDNLEVITNENTNDNHVNDKQPNGSTVQETSSVSEEILNFVFSLGCGIGLNSMFQKSVS